MAITFVAQASTNTFTVNLPGSARAGDLAIVAAGRTHSDGPSLPSGWEALGGVITGGSGDSIHGSRMAWKILTEADIAAGNVGTWTNANEMIVGVYRGASGAHSTNFGSQGGTTTMVLPERSIIQTGSWVVALGTHRTQTGTILNVRQPAGWTNRSAGTASAKVFLADRSTTNTSDTSMGSLANSGNVGHTVEIEEALDEREEFTQISYPGSSTSNTYSLGTHDWRNPENVEGDTDDEADTATPLLQNRTHWLWNTDFGFDIKSAAEIKSIKVEFERRASSISTNSPIWTDYIRLIKNGSLTGDGNGATGDMWTNSYAWETYTNAENSNDPLWASTWIPGDINSSNFGVAIVAGSTSTLQSSTPYIRRVRVTVTYLATPTATSVSRETRVISQAPPSSAARDVRLVGSEATQVARGAFTSAQGDTGVSRSVAVTGEDESLSERDVALTGQAVASEKRSTQVVGQESASIDRESHLFGVQTTSVSRSIHLYGDSQLLRPVADISVGDWEEVPLWEKLTQVAENVYTTDTSAFEIRLEEGSAPDIPDTHYIRFSIGKDGPQTVDFTVTLLDGTTVIEEWEYLDVPQGYTDIEEELESFPAYNDLRLRFTAEVS
jgi:hypothetical protein